MALPTLSALKSQKTSAAVTCVFGQNQEFEIPEACSKQCLIMSDHDQLHPADQPELHLRHHRLQLQQGEHRGGGTGPCTHCRGGAESVLTLSSTVIGVGLHRLGANLTRRKGKYTSASPRCTCLPSRQICIGVALGDPPQTPLQC